MIDGQRATIFFFRKGRVLATSFKLSTSFQQPTMQWWHKKCCKKMRKFFFVLRVGFYKRNTHVALQS